MRDKNIRPRIGDRLKAALTEGISYSKGATELTATVVPVGKTYTGSEVTAIRTRRHLSQAQFAKLLAVSLKTLQSWEQGVRKPSKPTMRLLQIFDTPEEFHAVLMVRESKAPYGRATSE